MIASSRRRCAKKRSKEAKNKTKNGWMGAELVGVWWASLAVIMWSWSSLMSPGQWRGFGGVEGGFCPVCSQVTICPACLIFKAETQTPAGCTPDGGWMFLIINTHTHTHSSYPSSVCLQCSPGGCDLVPYTATLNLPPSNMATNIPDSSLSTQICASPVSIPGSLLYI